MHKKLLSIIVPVYNEEKNLSIFYEAVSKELKKLADHYNYELVFVDDGSMDGSFRELQQLRKCDEHICVFRFSRNFGHQAALTCGLENAKGDFVVTMDADLQDPPELIPQMLEKAESGVDIVYARRKKRHEGWVKRTCAKWYYKLLRKISQIDIPGQVGDYRLISKQVLIELNRCKEHARYLRGIVAWLGFERGYVEFDRPHRRNGISGYSWGKMFKLGFDGFTGFSFFPLRIAAFFGVFNLITGGLMLLYIMYDFLLRGTPYPLYKWLVVIIYGSLGAVFIMIWILGEYIGRIYDEQKDRPTYIIREASDTTQKNA